MIQSFQLCTGDCQKSAIFVKAQINQRYCPNCGIGYYFYVHKSNDFYCRSQSVICDSVYALNLVDQYFQTEMCVQNLLNDCALIASLDQSQYKYFTVESQQCSQTCRSNITLLQNTCTNCDSDENENYLVTESLCVQLGHAEKFDHGPCAFV